MNFRTLPPATVAPEIERRDDGTFAFFADGVEIEWPLATTCSRFPVQPDFYGFEVASTGGGCSAWARDFTFQGRRLAMLITDVGGCEHEVSDDDATILLGVYEDGEVLCNWVIAQGERGYDRGYIERYDAPPTPVGPAAGPQETEFDQHDAALLNALGYSKEHNPASWEDVGDCENGPKLVGGEAFDLWTRQYDDRTVDFIVVCGGKVAESGSEPAFLHQGEEGGAA